MQGLCVEKKAVGPRKRLDCSTLQSIADKESANRDQARALPPSQLPVDEGGWHRGPRTTRIRIRVRS